MWALQREVSADDSSFRRLSSAVTGGLQDGQGMSEGDDAAGGISTALCMDVPVLIATLSSLKLVGYQTDSKRKLSLLPPGLCLCRLWYHFF